MTPAQYTKASGIELKTVIEMTGQSPQSLSNWHKYKPDLFRIIVLGCVYEMELSNDEEG